MTRHVQADERLGHDAAATAASAAHVTAKADKESLSSCTLAVLLVAVAALLPAAYAAPTPAPAAPKDPVWINPCGTRPDGIRDAPGNINMKATRKALKVFRDYLNSAVNNASKEWQRASSVYRGLIEDGFSKEMDWLPRNQYIHYKENVQGLKPPEKLVLILQHVHDGVQKFLATAVWLQRDEASSLLLHKDLAKRTDFLARISAKLRSVQCAAQTAIVGSQARLLVHRSRIEDVVDVDSFPQPSQSTSELLLRDRAFLRRLQDFLREWQRALKEEFRAFKKKPAGANPRRQRHRQKKGKQQQQRLARQGA